MEVFTVTYRGFEIDAVNDPKETGDWPQCPFDQAEMFAIYPPDDDLCLWADSFAEAVRAVDQAIAKAAA